MGKNSTININTPHLRFPGFTGEWKEKTLGEVGVFVRGLSYNKGEVTQDRASTLVLRSNNIIQDGAVDCKNGLQFVTKEPSPEQILQKGDIVICLSNGSSNLVGKSASYEGDYAGIATVGAFCGIYRSTAPITKYLVQTLAYKKSVELIKQGGNGALANLYGRDILGLKFNFPSLEEQNIIVDCLEAEDRMIAAQDQKVKSLKAHKTGLMQQIFPQNGETTPRLRFPGFTGEWEEKKLVDLARKMNRRNRQLEVSRVLTNSANDGVVDQSEYFDRDIAVKGNTENYHIVELNDFVYNPRISTAAPVGPISINRIGKGIMSPLYTVFKFHKGYVPFFEYYFQTTIWHPYLKSIANFGARFDRMNITSEGFFDMPIYLPSTQAEQQKIASCLSSLDDTIQSETDKLEALKAHKKGLMQQLFPQHSK